MRGGTRASKTIDDSARGELNGPDSWRSGVGEKAMQALGHVPCPMSVHGITRTDAATV